MSDKKNTSAELGTGSIGSLLFKQAAPAAIGFLLMSVNMIVDAIFVGQLVGKFAIGAISVVSPIAFFMSSFGMGLGIGGASVISRALGSKDNERANLAFNNQLALSFIVIALLCAISFVFKDFILDLYSAKGDLRGPSDIYYTITMIGVPFLSFGMLGNNNLRSEGKANQAMMVLLIPSILNMILDYVLLVMLDWGMEGAAWATTLSYMSSGVYIIWYYISGRAELQIVPRFFKLKTEMVKAISGVGSISVLRQGSISLLMILLNAALLKYGEINGVGGENAVTVYGIASRIAMFAFFPLIGIAQGMVPIVGFNYGAKKYKRVIEVIRYANISGFIISCFLCASLLLGSDYIPMLFLGEEDISLLPQASEAIFYIFMGSFLVVFQLVGASYYQALGKATPALLLTLTKQLFILVPLIIVIPPFLGLEGIWYSFTIADVCSAMICSLFLFVGLKKLKINEQ